MMHDGWIILDKPSGMFSRRAAGIVARMFGARTFGHIGTLDEMASGVLPVALGNATKMIPFVEEIRPTIKEYTFSLKFGFETDTLDAYGRTLVRSDVIPSRDVVTGILPTLTGDVMQTPPAYSAVHIDGHRAYDVARRGGAVELPARCVHIETLELLDTNGDEWTFRTRCGRGTYVRAIARDIAKKCNSVATVTVIRRTESIGFTIKDAVKLDFLEKLVNNGGDFGEYLKSVDFGLGDIPVQNLDGKSAELYKNGGFIVTSGADGLRRVYCGSEFIGIGYVASNTLRPKRTIK